VSENYTQPERDTRPLHEGAWKFSKQSIVCFLIAGIIVLFIGGIAEKSRWMIYPFIVSLSLTIVAIVLGFISILFGVTGILKGEKEFWSIVLVGLVFISVEIGTLGYISIRLVLIG